ncbi:hypothetical protein Pcinc_036381 [Petrolisthes cinctipes]|uniref:Uncharacterized protein n=1 Tax=Petrolisthes cinctipes TaxID=88211 RepID=A0AAE1BW99_PETCI|nr:hypothetical protein Pcinc_036381 [Petrolisthes cinctipes]
MKLEIRDVAVGDGGDDGDDKREEVFVEVRRMSNMKKKKRRTTTRKRSSPIKPATAASNTPSNNFSTPPPSTAHRNTPSTTLPLSKLRLLTAFYRLLATLGFVLAPLDSRKVLSHPTLRSQIKPDRMKQVKPIHTIYCVAGWVGGQVGVVRLCV